MNTLFPFSEYWEFYLGFTAFVVVLLVLDLCVFHRHAHKVSVKEAAGWSVFWVALGLGFGFGLQAYCSWSFPQNPSLVGLDHGVLARQVSLEYFTGFVIEKALAVDNLFVFVMVFAYFAIPPEYQHRILFFGILGALIFRAIFIALGSVLLQYKIVVLIFGIFLIATGIKILFAHTKSVDPGRNPLIRLLTRWLPVTEGLHGQRFFVRQAGRLFVTPLFITLIFIEISDIIFAVDSVPAIFAITKEPLIVFTSNVFAILGMRALYFLLAGMVEKFHLLHYALGTILVFVGLKMTWLNEAFGGKFPIVWSLSIILVLLAASIVASLCFPPRKKELPPPVG